VRTTAPQGIRGRDPWTIRVGGLVRRQVDVALPDLVRAASERGPYVMECAGNNAAGQFGLMSAARWTGVSLDDVLARVEPLPAGSRVLVEGVDHAEPSRTSTPGASWIFTRDELRTAGAFLATGMNGQPLPADHGWPVRLLVPGWYGCACIKWVDRISLVGDDAPATPHMREFGPRTFQDGRPALAREFKPAAMDLAAMPIRVEKWILRGRPVYRVVGLMWGGTRPIDRLAIRFNPREPYTPFQVCADRPIGHTWSMWSQIWRPVERGKYLVVLRSAEPAVPTPRLDVYYYTRAIVIDEV
jgi:DMSO/TMAO reductase YedYZ molybdopterin-dependent catalytic subunit